jgi:hypothetical protein
MELLIIQSLNFESRRSESASHRRRRAKLLPKRALPQHMLPASGRDCNLQAAHTCIAQRGGYSPRAEKKRMREREREKRAFMCVLLHDKQSTDLKILSTSAALLRIVKIAFARTEREMRLPGRRNCLRQQVHFYLFSRSLAAAPFPSRER